MTCVLFPSHGRPYTHKTTIKVIFKYKEYHQHDARKLAKLVYLTDFYVECVPYRSLSVPIYLPKRYMNFY